eukprot:20754-Chlamydomonas_euryale.AAC.3
MPVAMCWLWSQQWPRWVAWQSAGVIGFLIHGCHRPVLLCSLSRRMKGLSTSLDWHFAIKGHALSGGLELGGGGGHSWGAFALYKGEPATYWQLRQVPR